MTTMQTQAFLDWLKADTGDGWHRYLRVDLKANTFMVMTRNDAGQDVYSVWSRGQLRCKWLERQNAEKEHEKWTKEIM